MWGCDDRRGGEREREREREKERERELEAALRGHGGGERMKC